MVSNIKKILYPTDLSENAKHAFRYAADLALKYDAMITILYVIEDMNYTVEFQVRGMLGAKEWDLVKAEKRDHLTQKIKAKIEDFCQLMDSKIDSCRLLVEDIQIVNGNPTEEIFNTAKDINADMIVMGSYGYNVLLDALIGGTTKKVVKNSEIPVLVVKLPKE